MIPQKTIEELITKHSILEKDQTSGTIDKKKLSEKSKEYSDLHEIIESAKKYVTFEKEKNSLEKILNDKNTDDELKNMAQIELDDLKVENKKMQKLKLFLTQKMMLIKKMQ